MKYCETHKDGRIASTTMCYQRYWDRAWDIMDEKVDVCVITEWVEKKVNQAQTERYDDLLMRIEGLLEDAAE